MRSHIFQDRCICCGSMASFLVLSNYRIQKLAKHVSLMIGRVFVSFLQTESPTKTAKMYVPVFGLYFFLVLKLIVQLCRVFSNYGPQESLPSVRRKAQQLEVKNMQLLQELKQTQNMLNLQVSLSVYLFFVVVSKLVVIAGRSSRTCVMCSTKTNHLLFKVLIQFKQIN